MNDHHELTSHQTLLIVDDDEKALLALKTLFQDKFNIITCSNGADAISAAQQSAVDLILLDIEMPVMNGLETCEILKQHSYTAAIPIIFLTGLSGTEQQLKALRSGALDFISKPVQIELLMAKVKNYMELAIDRKNLTELSNKDELTGLANRRHIEAILNHEWYTSTRADQPLSILMIDIDNFKIYNDNFGHAHGDRCLKQVAAAMVNALHRENDCIGRYGGEEFLAVLPQTDSEGAVKVTEDLLASVRGISITHPENIDTGKLTVSIGIATFNPDPFAQNDYTVLEMLDQADRCLYEAKAGGKNTYRCRQ